MIQGVYALIPALLIVTALALIWGGLTEKGRGGDKGKAVLMIVAGVVFLGNAALLIGT